MTLTLDDLNTMTGDEPDVHRLNAARDVDDPYKPQFKCEGPDCTVVLNFWEHSCYGMCARCYFTEMRWHELSDALDEYYVSYYEWYAEVSWLERYEGLAPDDEPTQYNPEPFQDENVLDALIHLLHGHKEKIVCSEYLEKDYDFGDLPEGYSVPF